jgi:NitT/TauT family transport system ATP-binding protein
MPGDADSDPAFELAIEAKRFAGQAVLREVAFTARPGEVLALLGPSGTGKTTTLRVAVGLDTDFAGTVRRPAGRLGMVFQEPRLLPWLNVADNLRLVTGPLPAARVEALLEEVGLPGTAAKLPREISLGMARRAALARAFAVEPALLVLDEPFASLDPQRATGLGAVVARRAHASAMTVLLATHELAQAFAIADRLLVLAGRPATLAADIAVPDRADRAAQEALRRTLVARFPFLCGNE